MLVVNLYNESYIKIPHHVITKTLINVMKVIQLLLFISFLTLPLQAQGQDQLMFRLADEAVSDWAAKAPSELQMAEIELNSEVLESVRFKAIDRFQLPLFDGIHNVDVRRIIERDSYNWSVTGWIDNNILNSFILTESRGNIFVTINNVSHHSFYEIIYSEDRNSYLLVKIDPHMRDELSCGTDHSMDLPPRPVLETGSDSESHQSLKFEYSEEGSATIDVMIVYTPAAKSWAESNAGGIDNVINQAMARAQLTVDNSDVDITFRLVHSDEVDYDETSTSSETDLYRLTASPKFNPWGPEFIGYMDEVHYWREQYGADLVAIFTRTDDVGGLAWLPGDSAMNSTLGFSLTRVQQAIGSTHIHEMGHNMGSNHSRNQKSNAAGASGGRTEYATGWRWTGDNDIGYVSVMTYAEGDTRVDLFSNPDITYQGTPTGSYDEESSFAPADNARSLNEVKHVIANYRPEGGTAVPLVHVAEKNLNITVDANQTERASIRIANNGNAALQYEIVQGKAYPFNDFTSSGGNMVRLNDTALSGTLRSLKGNFVLDSQKGDTRALDIAIRVTETPEYSNANVIYQFGGGFSPTENVSWWQHGWSRDSGTAVNSTIQPGNSVTSDNFYIWAGNTSSTSGDEGTWSGTFHLAGVTGADDFDISIASGTGSLSQGSSRTINLEFDPKNKPAGIYHTNISVVSNDPLKPVVIIPVSVEVAGEPSLSLSYNKEWNLIGVPVETAGIHYSDIFRNNTGNTYMFTSAYQHASELIHGRGYWVHLHDAEDVLYESNRVNALSLNLNEGWNLVSGPGYAIPETAVEDQQNIISSAWHGFDGSYFTASEIEPGYGYWVRASEDGSITLDYSNAKALASQQKKQPGFYFEASAGFNSLSFISESDTLQTLYFGGQLPDDVPVSRFELPPLPPPEAFDARFSIEETNLTETNTPEIKLQLAGNENLHLLLEAQGREAAERWEVVQFADRGYHAARKIIHNGEKFRLQSADISKIKLIPQQKDYGELHDLPDLYKLEQNYPNPFNPVTQIRFQLPAASDVRLDLYDMTGRHVATLVNGRVSAGSHSVSFDSSNLSSGVYIYRLQAGEFQQARRLTVIK